MGTRRTQQWTGGAEARSGPALDITLIIGIGVLLVASALLLLVSSAEAAIAAISRGRLRNAHTNGRVQLLARYVRDRQRILSTLSVATAVTVVAAAAAFMLIVLRGRDVSAVGVAAAAAVSLIAVLLLRQTARTVALLSPEATGARLARPIRTLQLVFSPLRWLAEAPIAALLRALGRPIAPAAVDPSEELVAMLETSSDPHADDFLVEERRMMRGIIGMSEQSVREIMSPRMDLTAISSEASIGDVMKLVVESGFSRIPLYEDSIDRVTGVVYAKDLLAYLQAGDMQPDLREIARPPYFVPETKRANELLADMRRDQVHMAIAVDEYGGTAGVVTVEDLLEEIVGEIADEYDTEEVEVQRLSDDQAIVDARLPLDELNELFGTEIDGEDFDTVGGLIFSLLGRLASPGDEVESAEHGLRLRVLSILGRRIKKVRVTRNAPAEESEKESAAAV